jgi:hypothetical protein
MFGVWDQEGRGHAEESFESRSSGFLVPSDRFEAEGMNVKPDYCTVIGWGAVCDLFVAPSVDLTR